MEQSHVVIWRVPTQCQFGTAALLAEGRAAAKQQPHKAREICMRQSQRLIRICYLCSREPSAGGKRQTADLCLLTTTTR
jgi:hypothetical protein